MSARLGGSSPAAGLLLARRFGRYNKWHSCRRRGVRLFHQPWKPCAGQKQGTLISAATMNPPCGRCNKPVYPTEKINCLDKVREVTHRHSDLLKTPWVDFWKRENKFVSLKLWTLVILRFRCRACAQEITHISCKNRRGVLGLLKTGKRPSFLRTCSELAVTWIIPKRFDFSLSH